MNTKVTKAVKNKQYIRSIYVKDIELWKQVDTCAKSMNVTFNKLVWIALAAYVNGGERSRLISVGNTTVTIKLHNGVMVIGKQDEV